MKIMDKLNPWMLYIKIAALAALFGAGVWLGFRLDPDTDCGVLDAETAVELATCKAANAGYEELENARALEASGRQSSFRQQMTNEVKAGALREQALAKKLAAAEKELKAADADPRCAELMELEICEAITIPLQPR
jgi:hypothetical protein